MSDFLKARSDATVDRDAARERISERRMPLQERTLLELQAIRKQMFWGPFWAIVAAGAVTFALWLLASLLV